METEFTYTIEDAKIERSAVSAAEWALLVANSTLSDEEHCFLDVVANCDADIECEDITWDCQSFELGNGFKIETGNLYRLLCKSLPDLTDDAQDALHVVWHSFGGADYTFGGQWVEA